MTLLSDRIAEFGDFIWNHASDAFQAKFDQCAKLEAEEIKQIRAVLASRNLSDTQRLADAVRESVRQDRHFVNRLLQITGLTRNKIVQDVKAYVRHERLRVSTSSAATLFNTDLGAELGSRYLAEQLHRVFGHLDVKITPGLLEAINQATWPGYIRQERAKRMGHEAEYRLACLFSDCGIPFQPEEKAENPLCRDVVIGGMSYDLVSPSATNALLRIVSTVHTANIGQYGESKDDLEIKKAVNAIKKAGGRERVTLLAFIDGVGFESNRAGLSGVLSNADEFCQFRTIWKAAVIAASKINKSAEVSLKAEHRSRFAGFCSKYNAVVAERAAIRPGVGGWIEAGEAMVRIR